MLPDSVDFRIRMAAFGHVQRLCEGQRQLASKNIAAGFMFEGVRVPLINPQRGIFKPQRMQRLLSIRTVYPRANARIWYDDQRRVHRELFDGEEVVDYAFMGSNPDAAENRWLKDACDDRVPIIYFLGTAPGLYQPVFPAYIAAWDAKALSARVSFGVMDHSVLAPPENGLERRYTLRSVKQRLHQATFREAVITAYGGRCAFSGLPEPLLLDAAHIIPDGDERLGQAVVSNGLPLSKIHHAAFDTHLIGIDPDFKIHVAERLMIQNDGPMLEALKKLQGGKIRLPTRLKDYPDRDRLAARFDQFRAAG